ncbi:MAG: ThuA domain-containing protein [Candidatus Synoicihabitans palmerolidicus]|nr:ThuA domain-containing protein [Candidatus Synoicihabitans palmerolidicus]
MLKSFEAEHDIAFTFSKDGSLFSPDYLAQFDGVFFYTSGNLEMVGTDQNPPMSADGKQALLSWIAQGGGFMAVHAGSDCFHTYERFNGNPPSSGARPHRYAYNGQASDPYIKMWGGEFINHGAQQVATVEVVDPKFPGMAELGEAFSVKEEWYSRKEFSPINHVLFVMKTAGMEGEVYARPDYPLAWAKSYGEGRVDFNAMGHRDSSAYQSMLVGAMKWAGAREPADITPNLLDVTPGAMTLPPPRKAVQ